MRTSGLMPDARRFMSFAIGGTTVLVGVTLCLAAIAGWAQTDDHPSNQPLRAAADMGYAPWAIKKPTGETDGFQWDVGNEIARRLGRPGFEMIDVNFSAIFSGLFAKRYEFIIAPTSITKERAEQMLFTEGYIDGGIGFVVRKADPPMKGPEDLQGKVLATNRGSLTDTWATENVAKYGYTVQRYDKDTDALQAVLTGRAQADIVDLYVGQYAATRQPQLKMGYVLYSDRQLGYPFRKDDVEFRNRVERIIECMKVDGTFVRIHRKWFGSDPGAGTSMTKTFPGYGPPGFPGQMASDHKPGCAS